MRKKKNYKQNNIINCLLEYLVWRENFIICNKNERLHTAQSNSEKSIDNNNFVNEK